jgi:two-component system NtrC family response regulator
MKRAVVMGEGRLIEAADLELEPVEPEEDDLDLRAARNRAELDVLQKAIARSRGRLAHAAKLLGISRPTLYTLLEAHGLSVDNLASAAPEAEQGGQADSVPLHNMD